jgi:cytochrome c
MRSWLASAAISTVAVFALAAACGGYAVIKQRDAERRAVMLTRGEPSRAPELMRAYGCAGCHQIRGVPGARGLVGPPLNDLARRVYIAGVLPNAPEHLIKFILAPREQVPNTAMPITGIDEAGARDVAAYLYVL